jgi:helix-turn-helix protein
MDKDSLRLFLDRGLSLAEIGRRAGRHPSTVGYWVKKHGLVAAGSARHRPRGGVDRTALEELVLAGGTHRSIALELGVSVATVRYWLKRWGLETRATVGRHRPAPRGSPRPLEIRRTCRRHGETRYILRRDGAYRCLRCQAESVARRRRVVRAAVIGEAGGRCVSCGYDTYLGALQFHHLDPSAKEFALSGGGLTRSLARVREEAKKCVLLCANCHAEVEAGVRTLALRFQGAKGLRADVRLSGLGQRSGVAQLAAALDC